MRTLELVEEGEVTRNELVWGDEDDMARLTTSALVS